MPHSRRTWMKATAMGVGGLLASERNLAAQPLNHACALADPRDEIKMTGLEIIPVNSLRSIFVKMHTDAGITGIGEGTVEGRIPTVVAAIKEIEPYLIGKDARRPAHHWQAIYRHAFYRGDIVLTCGKAHESSMCYGTEETPWDEFAAARAAIQRRRA